MRWKQFLTPVQSFNADQARKYIDDNPGTDFTILDVRQPNEYERGHIPGAKLIPIPELMDRLPEIDSAKPVLVYCAIGGRSRIAAQMLSGKNFPEVINLSGGFKSWQGLAATGGQFQGLELFKDNESPEKALVVAYSLEAGLHDFYVTMGDKVKNAKVQQLFLMLSDIELKHQQRLLKEYENITGTKQTPEGFEKQTVTPAIEGGLTTEEYIRSFPMEGPNESEVIELAMSIEAQALDLYMRTAEKIENELSKKILIQIASEEKAHLKKLGELMEQI